ncbi:MAG: low molecular weight phosphotyrosine protein phosphatase [Treponema sp.]|nr:low molecular weight phosphotyrosine protein phosphatase [Treponema sp.]
MKRILFVCHGNICRSPMAEFVMKNLARQAGLENELQIDSAATSTEEIGNGMHYGTRTKLAQMEIPYSDHRARRLERTDAERYDLIVGMDQENLFYMSRILGSEARSKIHLLLEWAGLKRDIADPWYTGNFDQTYDDIDLGCRALLDELKKTCPGPAART